MQELRDRVIERQRAASASIRMAVPVNAFVTEPRRNTVSGETGVRFRVGERSSFEDGRAPERHDDGRPGSPAG